MNTVIRRSPGPSRRLPSPTQVAAELAGLPERDPHALSPRQLAVLRLIAEGQSNRQIGALLGISRGTVKHHVTAALVKLRAKDRTHAAVIAWCRGIIT